jgi:hypothetical protein
MFDLRERERERDEKREREKIPVKLKRVYRPEKSVQLSCKQYNFHA